MELAGVPVERVAGAGHGVAKSLPAFLDLPAATFQDPHPSLGRGAVEERQVYSETVVGVVLRAGVDDQFGETTTAGIGQLIDPPGATQHGGSLGSGIFDDQSVGLHTPQGRVQRAVGEGAESSEQPGQALAEFVAVHRGLLKKTQNGEFQHLLTSL